MSAINEPPHPPAHAATRASVVSLGVEDSSSGLHRISWPEAQQAEPLVGLKGASVGRYALDRPLLAPGSRIGILCDTLVADPELGLDMQAALATTAELIRNLGYRPIIDAMHARVSPYFGRWAGDARSRAEHFVRLLDMLDVDAVFPLFGKGGGHDVIGEILASGFRPRRPVVLIGGFSHHTDWSLFALSPLGRDFFSHVLNVTQGAYWKTLPQENVMNLRAVLHEARSVQYGGLIHLNPQLEVAGSSVRGPLVGGNMGAVLLSAYRAWMPSFAGTIALCEDYDKHPHDVHRGFLAFSDMVVKSKARAIVVGSMLPLKKTQPSLDADARKAAAAADRSELITAIREVASRLPIPVFHHAGLFGHGALNCPLGLGGETRIRLENNGSANLVNELRLAARYRRADP